MFVTFYRLIKAAVINYMRNGWLSIASTIIMTLTLITISTFLVLNIVLTEGIKTIEEKIDVSAYLEDEAEDVKIVAIEKELSENPDVRSVKYVSKEEAKQIAEESFSKNEQLTESLEAALEEGDNPLPASIEVKVYDPEKLESVVTVFDKEEYTEMFRKISYKENKEVIDKLFTATKFIERTGWAMAAIFISISLIVIFNTVRVAIYTHKEEIEIMKLVGANPWFITWPFIIEGILYGILGTILSLGVTYLALNRLSSSFNNYFGNLGTGDQFSTYLSGNIGNLILLQLIAGVFIGATSSYIAIRKHLKKL